MRLSLAGSLALETNHDKADSCPIIVKMAQKKQGQVALLSLEIRMKSHEFLLPHLGHDTLDMPTLKTSVAFVTQKMGFFLFFLFPRKNHASRLSLLKISTIK